MKTIVIKDSQRTEEVNVFPFDACEYPFNIEVCGYTECHAHFRTVNNPCRNYIIEYIVKGGGTLVYNGRVFHPKAGDLYLLGKGSNNTYYSNRENPWTKLWITVDGLLIPNLLSAYGLLDTVLVKDFQDEAAFRKLIQIAKSNLTIDEMIARLSLHFHSILQKIYQLVNRKVIKSDAQAIRQIIDANIYKADFRLSSLSETMHLSQTQIINIFKKRYGQTPYYYLMGQRVKVSGSMLLKTQMSIKAISESLNFADQHYFSNVFKRYMGESPQKYREKNQLIYNKIIDDAMKKSVDLDP